MANPVVSTNVLPLSSPYRLHGALQLIFAAVVAVLAVRAWPEFFANIKSLQQEFNARQPDPQPVLLARTLVQGLGFLLAAWVIVRNAFGGLHRLLSFFIPVGIPGELGQAAATARQLFVDRVFGHFDRRTSLADKALVRLAPRLLYLTAPALALLRAVSSVRVLLWCGLAFFLVSLARPEMNWPWGVLAVVLVGKLIYACALFLLTPPQPQLNVTEDRQHFDNTGNPVNFYNHIEKLAIEMRHQTFPNRVYVRTEPDLTNVQPNVTSKFEAGYLFETQPLPVNRGAGRLPALFLALAGVGAGVLALYMLLDVPAAEPAQLPPAWTLAWVLTAVTAFGYSRSLLSRALGLLQVFRFESQLFWIGLKGSYTSSAIGVGDGRGGQFYAERRSIQSDTYIVAYGAKIITEASGLNALRAPRIIVNTTADEQLTSAFGQLLGGMPTFKDSTSALPTIAFERPGVKEILQANLAVTGGMARATAEATLLPDGARPSALLPDPSAANPALPLTPTAAATPAPAAVEDGEMKVCPECGEKIRAIARKCRFCNHRFDGAAGPG